MAETLDLVIVGAGWHGLCAAKTNRQLHPESSFAILDGSATIGGVWAEHRLYPGLKSNNMLGTYEYPDYPMDSETYGVKPGEHIPGAVLHKYLNNYANHFGIASNFRGNTKVVSAEAIEEGGWTLTLLTGEAQTQSTLIAKKLIVSAGLTSEPFLPHFEGQETFGKPLFHSRDFKAHSDTLNTAKSVTIFGGTKSAWDMVYAYASKGIKVDWVIRSSGHGPAWMSPAYVTPLKKWLEKLVMTRMLTWFSPCIWGDSDGYTGIRGFYHGSALGRSITNTFWGILGGDVLTLNKYDSHPETAKLKPWTEAMFTASSFSILNYETDFFDLVRDGTIKVHITEISSLAPGKVNLADGTVVETDLLGCVTGWKHVPPMKFLPEGIDKELGLPHAPTDSETIFTEEAVKKADEEIFKRYPRLKDQPKANKDYKPLTQSGGVSTTETITPSTTLTPYTLYRFVLPPSEKFIRRRDIAFGGIVMNFGTPLMAQLQSLWILALFDGTLPKNVVPDADATDAVAALQYQTVLTSRFGKWRYPAGHGSQFPDFVFDTMPYIDQMLTDLGLPIYRKAGWLAEATAPYGCEDYKTVVAEWQAKVAASGKSASS